MFFGTDKNGSMVMLCVNQIYSFKQSNSYVYIRDHNGLELSNKGMSRFRKIKCVYIKVILVYILYTNRF